MSSSVAVALPIGLWHSGARERRAVLRPMTGRDQEFLMDTAGMRSAFRTSALLARCVERIGPVEPVTAEIAGRLTVGDREALLLGLRRLTFGERMDPVVSCPRPECGRKMDVSLRVADLMVAPAPADAPQYYERELPRGGMFRFRLPEGQDQEAVAELATRDPHSAARILLSRCVDPPLEELTEEALTFAGGWMADLDAQAEIRLDLSCPECEHNFTSLFDAGAYLFEETVTRARELYREVHLLAFHYHWSEAEILGMTPSKRRRYLDLLLEALG